MPQRGGCASSFRPGPGGSLVSVLKHNRQEFDAYVSRPQNAYPVDGEPVKPAPVAVSTSGIELYCRIAGGSTRGTGRLRRGLRRARRLPWP